MWDSVCKWTRALMNGLVFGLGATAAQAQVPLVKRGACGSGYHSSGNYCTPSTLGARPAIPKSGSCRSGYHNSGNYRLASRDNAKPAVAKAGACLSGYHTSGAYCQNN